MKITLRFLKPIRDRFRGGEGTQENSKKSDPLPRSQSEVDIGPSPGPTPSDSQRRESDGKHAR